MLKQKFVYSLLHSRSLLFTFSESGCVMWVHIASNKMAPR
jgi:hypothetical protein